MLVHPLGRLDRVLVEALVHLEVQVRTGGVAGRTLVADLLTGDDNGKHTFNVTFNATGPQTVTVTDNATSITGTEDVYVVNLPHHGGWWL